MNPFNAYYLPQLDTSKLEFRALPFGSLEARIPVLSPVHVSSIVRSLQYARDESLARVPTSRIVEAVARTAACITAPDTPEGRQVRTLLPAATGYSAETIDDLLAHMARDWSAASLEELLRRELGSENAKANGPRLTFQVFSGNVPGVAVTSLIRSLLVRAATLGKTASGEPVLPVLFARILAGFAPEIASALAITYWPGGSVELENVALQAADAVVVYGGAATVESLRSRAAQSTPMLVHGPRISFGIVGRAATIDIATDIARATAAYDQQGCVSPHVVYVEQGGELEPKLLAQEIARELDALEAVQPRRRVSHSEALAIRQLRAEIEFRGFAEADTIVIAPADTGYTVLYDDTVSLPISCLNRTLFVIPIDDAHCLQPLLEAHRELLQSVAIAGMPAPRRAEIVALLVRCGVTRITTFERLPWPPMWWHHDGRGPLTEFLFHHR